MIPKLASALVIAMAAGAAPASAALFTDDFESGLGKWQDKGTQTTPATNGAVVNDPLNASNKVLAFRVLDQAGSIFSVQSFAQTAVPYVLSFDYLGYPAANPNNALGLGGFAGVGIASGDPCDCWLAGTVKGYTGAFGEVTHLVDDGKWRRYSITFLPDQAELTAGFRMMLEDFSGSGGVPGDAFFDNIELAPVPEPSTYALLIAGLAGLGFVARRRRT